MIRVLEGERPVFVLDTAHTTYAFRVTASGHLEHLYYGRRILVDSAAEAEAMTEKRAYSPGNAIVYSPEHPTFTPEDTCLELSGPGKGDLRESFLELVHPEGSRTCDFLFEKAEVSDVTPPEAGLPQSWGEPEEGRRLTVTLREADYGLTLTLYYIVWPECDVICRSAELTNGGSAPVTVERLLSLQLDLPEAGWSVTGFHGAWAREMEKYTVPLPAGKTVIESRAGSSSNRMNPFFMVHAPAATETAGNSYAFNLLYSGNHYAAVEVNAWGKTRVVTGLNPQGFRWRLDPGESFRTPEAAMVFSHRGFGDVSRSMQRFVRNHVVRGVWAKKARPVLLNSWEASYFKFNEASLLALAKAAKDLGAELFVMDDGWFGQRSDDTRALGDWDPNPKKLPGGLAGLGSKVKALGLDFGVWVEPEMVNVQSDLYAAHPDWVMALPGKPHSEGRNQRILDLANPAVQDFLIEKMTQVFSSAEISYVKWDYNRVFSDVYSPYLPPERQGETAHRYILGLYRVMGELTRRFPEILFEGCASGGGRFDLGILSYFPQIWASDNTDAVSRASIQEGYSYGYPMSVVAAHISAVPNHQTLRITPADTRFHVAAFGVLGLELDPRDLSAADKKELRAQLMLYKQWREVFQFGDFYRGRTGNLHEWTVVSPDRKRAVGMLLQELVQPNVQFERFFARGLEQEAKYRFRNDAKRVNIKKFGSLVNTAAPFHVRQDSFVHNVLARAISQPGEQEDVMVSGRLLMYAGVKLKQAFSGTGYDENVRFFADFSSRLYFMETEDAILPDIELDWDEDEDE